MKDLLQSYLKRLTNLSSNNRSLLLLRLLADQHIDVHEFDFILGKNSFHIIEQLLASKSKIDLCREADSRDAQNNTLSLKIKRLSRKEKLIFEESGSKDLYLGWPFIRGKFHNGSPVQCPLIFFPVELSLNNQVWQLRCRDDQNASFNKSFLLAYSFFNKITLGDEILEKVFDEIITDSRIFRTELYQWLKESPVELHFNQENFLDQLHSFTSFGKNEFIDLHKEGELKLFPEAVLGIFPQAGSYLVPDYQQLIDENYFEDLEKFFETRSLPEDRNHDNGHSIHFNFLSKVKEEHTYTPFEVDAYQENAIKAVKRGNSIVVQGPPGTGKSQLICNLAADFMARGKKVLIVCQKRAALDVVYERLKREDMHDFASLVHDFKNDRKTIYGQIQKQIDRLYEFKVRNNSLDAIQLERNFLQTCRKIEQINEELDEFKFALFNEEEAGISVKELYLSSDRNAAMVNLKQEFRYFKIENLNAFEEKLRNFFLYYRQFDINEHPWKNRKSFAGFGVTELQLIRDYVQEIPLYQKALKHISLELIGAEIDFQEGERIFEQHKKIIELLNLTQNGEVFNFFKHIATHSHESADELWLSNMEKNISSCFDENGPEVSLQSQELGHIQTVLHKYKISRRNLFSYLKWRFFSKEKPFLQNVLNANKLSFKKEDLQILEQMIDNRLNLEHNLTKIRAVNWLIKLPEHYNIEAYKRWFVLQKQAVKSFNIFRSFRGFRSYFNPETLQMGLFRKKMTELLNILSNVPLKRKQWSTYLKDWKIESLLNNPAAAESLINSLERDFDALCEYDSLKKQFSEVENAVLGKLLDHQASRTEKGLVDLLKNSIMLAWIDYIESKYPVLRSVSTHKFQQMRRELVQAIEDKQQMGTEITLMHARERTYEGLEYNRLNNLVSYRELSHQVTKKRKVWPLRKLLNAHSEDIFKLIPCWLASPEAVSAIFPMEALFDLVIFDEASQCFAERAIPSMYRGKQMVVCGDSKQLSPFDIYQIRWEDDEIEQNNADLEVDSLLDLSARYLMQVYLRGHYRSQSLELIDFSNRYFYEGKLQLLPARDLFLSQEKPIQYIKTEGVWKQNTNYAEAELIAKMACDVLQQQPEKEIGIVTFNARQQELIIDLLEEEASLRKINIPDSLIVKNIENVQGDEKDIIFFSIAYAPDISGKMRFQFGSLSAMYGENRLNVAITRARDKIIVVSSIFPHQLQTGEAKNEGPKLLKKYLEYALDVSEGRFQPFDHIKKSKNLQWYLKEKLVHLQPETYKYNIKLTKEMPFADLTLHAKEPFSALLLTDDDLYHQSISSKDFFAYHPGVLNMKKWNYDFFFSRELWHNQEMVIDKILKLAGFERPEKENDQKESEGQDQINSE
ncbi:MAG: DUF4011 domain-containing protein [Cyclobacteriaceae bacterium]|nr:DUF4011 domain-containing protein [Cyclobacteriaceae bacterium]